MRALVCALMVFATATVASGQTSILIDNFDDPRDARVTSFTITPDQATFLAGGDSFGRGKRGEGLPNGQTNPFAIIDESVEGDFDPASPFPGDVQGIFGQAKDDAFFGVVDLANDQNTAGTGTAEWTIDISSLSDLALMVDAGAMGDFEAGGAINDQFSFSASIDGGAFTTVMLFAVDEALTHTYRPVDLQAQNSEPGTEILDPIVYTGPDGAVGGGDDVILDKTDPATGALDSFTAPIAGMGSTMVLRFSAVNDGGSEAFAFDNLKLLTGVVDPGEEDADFDGDGDVDGADFLTFQRNLGVGDMPSEGDANGDSVVDAEDLAIFRQQFGNGTAVAAAGAIPEPASLTLLMCSGLLMAAVRRRRI